MVLRASLVMVLAFVGCWRDSPVHAEEANADAAFQQQLFGRSVTKDSAAFACFVRSYDRAHIASHPRQNVRAMKLLVTGRDDGGESTYTLGMDVTFKGTREHFGTSGSCGSLKDQKSSAARPTVHCGVDCDGGDIDVTLKDSRSVLVGIPDGARISASGEEDEESVSHRKRFGSDDKLFRLDRAPLMNCLPLANEDDQKLIRHMR